MLLIGFKKGYKGNCSAPFDNHRYWKSSLFLICFFAGSHASKYERALLKKLFHSNYDKNERPVVNDSDAVIVVFGLTLNQIVDVVRCSEQLYTQGFFST